MLENTNIESVLDGVDKSWKSFFTDEIKKNLFSILNQVYNDKQQTTPEIKIALRFLKLPLNSIKVLILGQDPYPQLGVATGRAFEVGSLKSWNDPCRNISLKNIVRSIYSAYNNEILKFSEIKGKLDSNFQILPPDKLFKNWESQGVLLLNTSFTCEIGAPGSHSGFWKSFTNQLLEFIAKENKNITWFIWGNHAQEAVKDIEIESKQVSMHPMMCYDKPERTSDFLFGDINHFKKTKDKINWLGN